MGEGSCWHLLCGAWDPAKHSTMHKSAPHGARLGNLALKNQQLANKPFGAASSGTAGHGLCHRIPSLDTTAWTRLGRLPSQRQPWPTSRFPVNPTGAEWFRQGPQRYSEPGRFSGTVNSSLRFTVTEKNGRAGASPMAQRVKNLPAIQETQDQSLGGKIPWRRKWQPTGLFLPEKNQWTREPRGLQSMGSQRV